MSEILQHALNLLVISLRFGFNLQPSLQMRFENIIFAIKFLHISNKLLLISGLIFNHPRVVTPEGELCHICMKSPDSTKAVFFKCVDYYFLLSFFLDTLWEFDCIFIQLFFVRGLCFFLRIEFNILFKYVDFFYSVFFICMILNVKCLNKACLSLVFCKI